MSKVYKKLYHLIPVLVLLALVFFPEMAWADETETIFAVIKKKAASSLKEIKMVVYIIGGFGLIGFAFMAVFNKISWKWFAHLAIGLFLVSAMGLFVDYFITQDGRPGTYSSMLDYGNYLKGSEYVPIEGGSTIPSGDGDKKTCEEDSTQAGCNKQQSEEERFKKECEEVFHGHYVNGDCLSDEEYQKRQNPGGGG